jgi:hypothetical protein
MTLGGRPTEEALNTHEHGLADWGLWPMASPRPWATLTLDKLDLVERQAIIGGQGKGKRERLVSLVDDEKRDGGRIIRVLKNYLSSRPAGRYDHNGCFSLVMAVRCRPKR